MAANPSSRWYWNDWENDLGLQLCSLAAQGLWMRMLSLAARSEPLGYISANGRSLTVDELSSLVGHTPGEVLPLLSELEVNHVFSRDRKGRIYNRRMVRDSKRSELGKQTGPLGGHPNIRRGTVAKKDRERRYRRSDSPKKTQRIFDRDGGKCHWCGTDLSDPTDPSTGSEIWHVDHVIAIADGGNNDETNLVVSCAKCNGSRALLSNPYGRNNPDHNVPPPPPRARPLPLPLPKKESKEDSEADASAGTSPAADPIKAMWDRGLQVLVDGGCAEKKARPLIGKWRREFGDAALMAAIASAENDRATEPIAFISGCLAHSRNGSNGNGRITAATERFNRSRQATLDAVLERERARDAGDPAADCG